MRAEIDIWKASGGRRMTAAVGKGSKRRSMLMGDDYVELRFSAAEATLFRLGDYVDIENVGRYELTEPMRPERNGSTGGYDYELRFDASYKKFGNKLYKYLPHTGSQESHWAYTDTIEGHAWHIRENLRALAYDAHGALIAGRETYLYRGMTDWEIVWDETIDAGRAFTVSFEGVSILKGIELIAEELGCEWWFEENRLHFGRCEYGEAVRLEDGEDLADVKPTESRESYATRLYVYGSEKNLASTYRKILVFEATNRGADGRFWDENRPLRGEWFRRDVVTYDPASTFRCELQGKSFTSTLEWLAPATDLGNVRMGAKTIVGDSCAVGAVGKGCWRVATAGLSTGVWVRTNDCVSSLLLTVTVSGKKGDGTAYERMSTASKLIGRVAMHVDLEAEDFEIVVEEDLHDVELRYELKALFEDFGRFGCNVTTDGKYALIAEKSPIAGAAGLTIDILSTETGEIERTIEGVTFNPEWEVPSDSCPLQLPEGKAIGLMKRYMIRELNTALVPASYFTSKYTASGKYVDVTTNGIVNSRLLLPETDEEGNPLKGYIDVGDFECEEEAVDDVVIFDDVYPQRTSRITVLTRSDEYYDAQPEQDGSTTTTAWKAWRFEDDLFNRDNPFDVDSYMNGDELQITFQSGLLKGMTFGVAYDSEGRFFEIQRDDKTRLPNEVIRPAVGDEFVLHGFNIAMLSDAATDYIRNAELELLKKGREYADKLNVDAATYECTVAVDHAYRAQEETPDGLYLGIGRRVMLICPQYFIDGRQSRVIGYEMPLDYVYDNPVYYVGETESYSRLKEMEEKIDGLGYLSGNGSTVGNFGGGGGTGGSDVYVIGQMDDTVPTDRNVYSARRIRAEYLLRSAAQIINHVWSFLKGIKIGGYVPGYRGAAIDAEGNGEFQSVEVRGWAKFRELIYNRLNAMEGDTTFADVGTIEEIVERQDGTIYAVMRRRWAGDFTAFQPGDIVYGYVNDLNDSATKICAKSWAWVSAVDREANALTLKPYPDSETPDGINIKPAAGMVISRHGNNIEANAITAANPDYASFIVRNADGSYTNRRQQSFIISCEQGNIQQLVGVARPIINLDNIGTILGRIPEGLLPADLEEVINPAHPYLYARGILVQDIIRVGYRGLTVRTQNYRGEWNAATAADDDMYYRNTADTYDAVTWRGGLWQNLVAKTTDEPSDSSAGWLRMTGTAAEHRGLWRIVPNASHISVRNDGSAYPELITCEVYRSAIDGDYSYKTGPELDLSGAELWVGVDGGDLREFVIGDSQQIETANGRKLAMRSGAILRTQGDNIAAGAIEREVVFELRDVATGDRLDRVTIAVVRDGKDGSDGEDGSPGPMVYPAGIWSEQLEYSSMAGASPCVQYKGQYYTLRPGKTCQGENPAQDWADNGESAAWQLMDRFSYVFADVLMANFAKLGSAVFYGDYMFSQDGTIDGVAVSGTDDNGVAYYTRFTDGQSAGSFIPNICVNFKSGYFAAAVGVFSGNLKTVFVEAAKSDAVTDVAGYYKIGTQHKLLTRENGAIFELPDDASLIGSRVMICDPRLTATTTTKPIVIKPEKAGDVIIGVSPEGITSTSGVRQIQIYAGVCEFLAVPKTNWKGEIVASGCQWMVLTLTARYNDSSDLVWSGTIPDLKPLPGGLVESFSPTVDPFG